MIDHILGYLNGIRAGDFYCGMHLIEEKGERDKVTGVIPYVEISVEWSDRKRKVLRCSDEGDHFRVWTEKETFLLRYGSELPKSVYQVLYPENVMKIVEELEKEQEKKEA